MKFLKTHYGRAIPVIKSDTVNIPNPAGLGMTGVALDSTTGELTISEPLFTTNLLGAIAYNKTNDIIGNVVGIVDQYTLKVDNSFGISSGEVYEIYNSDNNQGCSIYIPAQTPGNLIVLTVGGDIVTFEDCGELNASTILPVNVLKVLGNTELSNLVALW